MTATPNPPILGSEPASRWRPVRLLFLVLGLVLLGLLLRQVGIEKLLRHAQQLGWTFVGLVLLYGGVHILRTLSWRMCLQGEGKEFSLRSLLSIWIAGEAVAYLSFGWSGEAFRAVAGRERIPVARNLSALVVSRMLYGYASVLLMAVSAFASLFLLPLEAGARTSIAIAGVILLTALLLPLWGAGTTHSALRVLNRLFASRNSSRPVTRVHRFMVTMEQDLSSLFVQDRRAFIRLLGVNLLATLVGVVEVFLILRALGVDLGLAGALLVEGGNKVLGVFAFLVPGNVGVREGGTVLILRLLNLGSALAVTLVLVRRARALVWVLVGCLSVVVHGLTPLLHSQDTALSSQEGKAAGSFPS